MKRIYLVFLLLFLMPLGVKAVNVEVSYIDDVYSNRPIGSEILSGPLGYIHVDDNFAYCLDPSVLIITGEGNYKIDKNYLAKTFTDEEIEYFNLVAYFGYEFKGHNNKYYYMAAQEMIWEKAYNKDFYWTTKQYPNGSKIDIEKYKEEIKHLIESRPFLDKEYTIKGNEELKITDETETLDLYKINENENLAITKEGNQLKITAKKAGDYVIKLNHKSTDSKSSLIYVASGYQSLGSMGVGVNLESSFKIHVEEEKKAEKVVVEDALPNTSDPDIPLKISSFCFICLGVCLLRKSF